ncbi:MAG: ABC transporter permease, partial [Terriglobales bacterium]
MADERRLREELAQHLAELTAEYERQGMPSEAARRAARLKLGGEDQIRALWRDARRFAWFDPWSRALRLAFRSLRRSPGYAAAVIVTLALAIGANVAVFSVTDALLLRPLPYSQPQQLMMVQGSSHAHQFAGISYPQFRAWRNHNHSFTGMAAWGGAEGVLTGHGQAVQLTGAIVSANLFSLLGVQPFAGRFFRDDEDRPHADSGLDPVVISHKLFESRFDGNPAALGSTLTLSNKEYVLVGVTTPGFVFPPAAAEDYWITAAFWAEPKPGLAPAAASASYRFLE